MYPGTQKSKSEFWSLSCFPVVRRRKLGEGAWVLLAVIKHCPLTALLAAGPVSSQILMVELGLSLSQNKLPVLIIRDFWLVCPLIAWVLAHSWVCCLGSEWSLRFQPLFCLFSQKQGLKEQFLWKSLPRKYRECSRDLCVAMHVFSGET